MANVKSTQKKSGKTLMEKRQEKRSKRDDAPRARKRG